MRILKKYIRKLYHLIWFLGVWFLFVPIINAETVNMTFSSFRTYAQSYGITYNSEIYSTTSSVPIDMNAIANGSPFEWVTSYNTNCSGQTVITGRFRFDGNPNLTFDFLQDNIKEIYYAPNIDGVSGTPCSWSVNPNNLQVSFTCSTNMPHNNFIVGGRWRYRIGSFSTQYIVWRNMNITCDNSASAIIDNNNNNTQSIINNNSQNTQDIINNNNNNSNNIINNNNQNTQDIINSSGSNTQSIIDNQNENSEKEIESQKVCKIKNIDKNNIEIDNKYLANNGVLVDNNILGVTSYIKLNSSSTLTITKANSATSCFYDENKTLISCFQTSSTGIVSIPQNANYFRATIQKGNNAPTFRLNYCNNGNQAIDDSLNNIDDTLNDSSVDSSDNTINNLKNQIPTNSVISDLLLLPVRFLQNFVNALGSSCSQFSLGSLYGTELFMPCINIENYLGSAIWTAIDLIISGMFVYALRKKFIEIYENMTNLRNGGNEVD